MALEYKTVRFINDKYGLEERNILTGQMTSQGWRIVSETIEQGHIEGAQACCLFKKSEQPAKKAAQLKSAIALYEYVWRYGVK